jgi:hypothetical protein
MIISRNENFFTRDVCVSLYFYITFKIKVFKKT